MSAISSLTPAGTSNNTNPALTAAPAQTLSQNDFLKLLVTQMTSQDPLDPQSDTDMASQMAQFSALQNSVSLDSDVSGLQANELLGRTVSVTGSDGNPASGIVTAVQLQAGVPEIVVNGQPYTMSDLTGILPTATTTTAPTSAPASN